MQLHRIVQYESNVCDFVTIMIYRHLLLGCVLETSNTTETFLKNNC